MLKTRRAVGAAIALLAVAGLATPAHASGNDNHPPPCRICHGGGGTPPYNPPTGPPGPTPNPAPNPTPDDPFPIPPGDDDDDTGSNNPPDDDSGDEPETQPADPGPGGSGGVIGHR